VLLVDASRDEREMYAEWFKLKGYCTLQASTGRDGFRLASELRPDVVITAIRLPGDMDGLSLTAVLKREPETCDLPVIVLTGCAFQHERDEASRSGCDRLVMKPCLPHVLAAVGGMQTAERRRTPRVPSKGEPPRAQLTSVIVGAYRELPGLNLTLDQAARLFGLRDNTCRVVLDDLIKDGKLRRSIEGRYVRV
jgi:CheY-like chemotaxis protein